jgi:hypothetical protein
MPVLGTILDYLGKTAEIDRLNQGTALTQIETQLAGQKLKANEQQLQMDEQYRQAILKGEATDQDPKQSNPKTSSVRSDESSNPSDPNQKIMRELQGQMTKYQSSADLALKYGKDPKPFLEQLRNVNTQLREVSKDVAKKQQTDGEQTANMLRDVVDPVSLRAAIDRIGTAFGEQQAKAIEAKLPHDQNGALVWNEAAKKTVAPLVSQYTSMAEKAKEVHNKIEEQISRDREKETEREHRALDARENSRTAIAQQNANTKERAVKATQDRISGTASNKVTKDNFVAIDKAEKDYHMEDYRKGYQVASRVQDKLLDPKVGAEGISAPEARVVVDQAKLMMDNYRSRTGGKYNEDQFKQMNGLIERASAYLTSWGHGNPILEKDVMLQMTDQMNGMFLDRSEDLARKKLSINSGTNRQGGNAKIVEDMAQTRRDIQPLVDKGRAKIVTLNGRDYVAFGKNKDDIYPLAEQPEMPKIDLGED